MEEQQYHRKVILLSVGTRGDVEPFCALVKEILSGHHHHQPHHQQQQQHAVDDKCTNTEFKQQQQQQHQQKEQQRSTATNTTTCSIDFFIQQNHEHIVRPLLLLDGNRSNISSSSSTSSRKRNRPLRIHTFPFTNQDYYNVPRMAKRRNDEDISNSSSNNNNNNFNSHLHYHQNNHSSHDDDTVLNDPRMSSVSELADIVGGLVLPRFDQVETVVLEHLHHSGQQKYIDCTTTTTTTKSDSSNNNTRIVIVTTALARPLAFMLAKIYHRYIKVVVVHLQPLLPNPFFPSYRVSVPNFVRSIMNFEDHHHHDDDDDDKSSFPVPKEENGCNSSYSNTNEVEETYWRLEYAMEMCFLRPRIVEVGTEIKLRHEEQQKKFVSTTEDSINDVDFSSIYYYYSWKELKTILSGHHNQFTIISAYSNQLVPRLDKTLVGTNRVYDVGPLADRYLLPGKPSSRLVEFLNNHTMRRPICIGFGSMVFPKPTTILVDALLELDHPAILVGSSLKDHNHISHPEKQDCDSIDRYKTFVREKIYHLDFIPHSYILPFCSMMVCHGGSGVVNACLRSGIPCLVAPVLGDQFAWASLLQAKGFGVQVSATLQDLTKDDMVNAIQKVSDPTSTLIVDNARRVGEQLQKSKGKEGLSLLATIIKEL